MNDSTPNGSGAPGSTALVARAKAITLNPEDTWPAIAAEPATPGDIITRYAAPLAAIGPLAALIGGQVFGVSLLLATYHPSLTSGLGIALTSFVMAIVSLIVIALVADFLAPNFGGTANRTQAFKLVAYSLTPAWIAGILGLVPSLAMLGVLAGIYSLYLFYLGAGPVMQVPRARSTGYTVVTALCAIVLMAIAGTITTRLTGLMGGGMAGLAARSGDNVEVNLPGGGRIDTANLEQASRQLEQTKDAKPVSVAALQALLPATLGGYVRTATQSGGAGGIGAQAEGTYALGDKTIRLRVVDMAAMGALAGIVGGLGVEENKEDANGYERTTTEGGQMRVEKWNRTDGSGSYGVQIASRFMVEAEGQAASIDDLKAAVASIDQGKLVALAR